MKSISEQGNPEASWYRDATALNVDQNNWFGQHQAIRREAMSATRLTRHAQKRMQKRNIPAQAVEAALAGQGCGCRYGALRGNTCSLRAHWRDPYRLSKF